jgi:hypothetical protein
MCVGASAEVTAAAAAAQAVAEASRGEGPIGFAIAFASHGYDPDELAAALSRELGPVPWAGCCTAGVFASDRLLTRGLVVGTLGAPRARFGVGAAAPVSADARRAGSAAASQALAGFPAAPQEGWCRALLVLSDAFTGNVADVVRGAMTIGGTGVVWAGGGAGDGGLGAPAVQFAGGRAHRDSVVVVAIDTPSAVAAGISHGFRPYGPPTLVTRAQGSVAFEMGYEAAYSVYRRTARERDGHFSSEEFPAFARAHPLGIPRADGEHVIRDPLAVEPGGALRCFGEVPDGGLIRMMVGDRAGLLAAAREAATRARAGVHQPAGALVFDCVSRRHMLAEGFVDELRVFAGALGDNVPFMGCLTFGEVGALGGGLPQFHNKTAVVLALGR